jgi:hypothetical protein
MLPWAFQQYGANLVGLGTNPPSPLSVLSPRDWHPSGLNIALSGARIQDLSSAPSIHDLSQLDELIALLSSPVQSVSLNDSWKLLTILIGNTLEYYSLVVVLCNDGS